MRLSLITIFLVLFADQATKIWVKLNMAYGESYRVIGDWFYIHFIENPGMAFGLEIGGDYGKIFLSVFRIISVIVIGWYLWKLTKKTSTKPGLLVSVSLILSGALGNIIDSVFYGIIFTKSTPFQVAEFMSSEGGYSSFLRGKVVDMIYFPMVETILPTWVPIWGGKLFTFFDPVFNIADMAISVGIGMMVLFQKRYYAAA